MPDLVLLLGEPPLRPGLARDVGFAGGIGITPMRAMCHELLRRDAPVHLVSLNRSRDETAYLDELSSDRLADSVTLHFDDETGIFDLWPVIAEPSDRTRVYCCGPERYLPGPPP